MFLQMMMITISLINVFTNYILKKIKSINPTFIRKDFTKKFEVDEKSKIQIVVYV